MLYEYECEECNVIMEVYQSINEPKLETYFCKKCNKETNVHRIIRCSTFLLKGDGWAKDGYCRSVNKCVNKCKCDK